MQTIKDGSLVVYALKPSDLKFWIVLTRPLELCQIVKFCCVSLIFGGTVFLWLFGPFRYTLQVLSFYGYTKEMVAMPDRPLLDP